MKRTWYRLRNVKTEICNGLMTNSLKIWKFRRVFCFKIKRVVLKESTKTWKISAKKFPSNMHSFNKTMVYLLYLDLKDFQLLNQVKTWFSDTKYTFNNIIAQLTQDIQQQNMDIYVIYYLFLYLLFFSKIFTPTKAILHS